MMAILDVDKRTFEEIIKTNFGFLESERDMRFGRVRASGGNDPRDAALVARYYGTVFRFDVGWSDYYLALHISIKFEGMNLRGRECYVDFESFIQYLTNGELNPIVPFMREGMSTGQIGLLMERRRAIFNSGLPPVVEQVATKVRSQFRDLVAASEEQVRGYHCWLKE